jgi:hypothetical protein
VLTEILYQTRCALAWYLILQIHRKKNKLITFLQKRSAKKQNAFYFGIIVHLRTL